MVERFTLFLIGFDTSKQEIVLAPQARPTSLEDSMLALKGEGRHWQDLHRRVEIGSTHRRCLLSPP